VWPELPCDTCCVELECVTWLELPWLVVDVCKCFGFVFAAADVVV
jgi:hypothetical protein